MFVHFLVWIPFCMRLRLIAIPESFSKIIGMFVLTILRWPMNHFSESCFCEMRLRKHPCPIVSYLVLLIMHQVCACLSYMRYICTRRLMGSTDQDDPSFFYYRISWILMERHCFYLFRPLHLVQGLRSLKHWLLQKLSMKIFDQKFKLLIKK